MLLHTGRKKDNASWPLQVGLPLDLLNLCKHFRRAKIVDVPISSSAMHAQWKNSKRVSKSYADYKEKFKSKQPCGSPGNGDQHLYSVNLDVLLVDSKRGKQKR